MSKYQERMKNKFLKEIFKYIEFYNDEEEIKRLEESKYTKEYFLERSFQFTLFSFADNKVAVDDDVIRTMISALETENEIKYLKLLGLGHIRSLLEYILGYYYVSRDIVRQYKDYFKYIEEYMIQGQLKVAAKNLNLLKEQGIIK